MTQRSAMNGMIPRLIPLAALLGLPLALNASAEVDVSFTPGAWSSNDWILVKGPRWDYMHGFVQRETCIENECPPLSGEEIFRRHTSKVYSAMVLKDRAEAGQTVSAEMSFDWRMAPLIVIAERLETASTGKPFWYLAAYLKVPFRRDVRYSLEVKVSRTRKGVKEMTVKCGGYEIGYVDNDLPDAFYAGIIGCEGRNRFYGFRIR